MPVPVAEAEAPKEEVLDCDLLDRMKGLAGYRIRAQKKAKPRLVAELPELKRSEPSALPARTMGPVVLILILLLLVGGLALAAVMASSLSGWRSQATSSQTESESRP